MAEEEKDEDNKDAKAIAHNPTILMAGSCSKVGNAACRVGSMSPANGRVKLFSLLDGRIAMSLKNG
jgi:hypothetical protein